VIGWVEYIPPLNLWNWPSFFQGDIMHPLGTDLSQLTDTELQTKYGELQKRFTQAYRFGPTGIIPQLSMLIEDYQYEINLRSRRQIEELNKNTKGPKGIIDIS
jgi:hypothetical protein